MLTDNDRLSRQHKLLAPNTPKLSVLIYGAGMLGSWTAHAIVRMVERVDLWDGEDFVEPGNVGNQAYSESDVEEPKSVALRGHLLGLPLVPVQESFPPSREVIPFPNVVIACADSMIARRQGAEWCRQTGVSLFIDTRASGLDATIITVLRDEYEGYVRDLPTDDELEGIPCGATGTAFVGMFVAARVASIIDTWADHRPDAIPIRESWHVGRAIPYEIEWRGGERVDERGNARP